MFRKAIGKILDLNTLLINLYGVKQLNIRCDTLQQMEAGNKLDECILHQLVAVQHLYHLIHLWTLMLKIVKSTWITINTTFSLITDPLWPRTNGPADAEDDHSAGLIHQLERLWQSQSSLFIFLHTKTFLFTAKLTGIKLFFFCKCCGAEMQYKIQDLHVNQFEYLIAKCKRNVINTTIIWIGGKFN